MSDFTKDITNERGCPPQGGRRTSTSLAALRCVPLSPLAAQSPWQAAAKAKGGETPRRRFLIYYKACSTWAALLCGAIMAWLRPRTPLCRAGWGPARASSCARASVSAARQQRRGARPCASPLRSVCRVALTRIDSVALIDIVMRAPPAQRIGYGPRLCPHAPSVPPGDHRRSPGRHCANSSNVMASSSAAPISPRACATWAPQCHRGRVF